MFLLIAALVLCATAFADGYTTTAGIKSGKLIEANKILDFLYRTNTPSAAQTFGVGFSIIGGEILLAWALIHHNVGDMNWFWPSMLLFQAGWHVVAAILNYRLESK
jgi:hypothetical protein